LAKIQACAHVCDERRFGPFARVQVADSPGVGLPASRPDTCPGAGGSAAQAGAKMQRVWDDQPSVFTHFALRPWNIPDQKEIETVVALAQKDDVLLFDFGYFKITALAKIAAANAYVVCRLNHQTTLLEAVAERLSPLALASRLATVERPLLEQPLLIGAKEQVAARLIAARVPEEVVNTRRRTARKHAKKTGDTPSQAPLTLLAWKLFLTKVPATSWPAPTVRKLYPLRWQVELIVKSWKSSLPLASIKTTKEDTT
jgi:hypothetical protein